MTGRTFGEDMGREMAAKAVMWGPALAGAAVAGPLGLAAGVAISIAIIMSGSSSSPAPSGGGSDSPPSNGEQPKK